METYRKMLTETGFHIDNITYTYYQKKYDDSKQLAEWLKQWLPHYKYLSHEKKDDFLEDLINNYLKIVKKQNENVYWGEYVLFVEATKLG